MSSDNGDTPKSDETDVQATQLRPAASDWNLRGEGESAGQDYPLTGELTIGRGQDCDLVLTSQHASRKHARIVLEDGKVRVEDLKSSNGTFVNGERIETAELKSGDVLRFDTQEFRLSGPEPEEATPQATMLRPAVEEKTSPEPEAKAEPEPEAKAEPEAEDADSSRRAWWESQDEGPKGTQLVDSDAMRDQLAHGGTQIVRGVESTEVPSLIGTTAPCAGQVFRLEKDVSVVGRDDKCDIIVDEGSVSARHAQIVREGDTWKAVDLLSANKTFVNGKVSQVAFLSPGDAVRFGRVEMRFVLGDTDVPSKSEPAQDQVIRGSGAAKSGGVPAWVFMLVGFIIVAAVAGFLFL